MLVPVGVLGRDKDDGIIVDSLLVLLGLLATPRAPTRAAGAFATAHVELPSGSTGKNSNKARASKESSENPTHSLLITEMLV